jgi:hypothetical protein
VYGVWVEGWNAKEVFVVYCLETIIIGFFTLTKRGIATAIRKKDRWKNNGSKAMQSGLLFILYFLVHYSLFIAVQTSIFFGVTSVHGGFWPSNILEFVLNTNKYLGSEGWLLLFAFVFGYGYENLMHFIMNND